jgi:hypothetical protein
MLLTALPSQAPLNHKQMMDMVSINPTTLSAELLWPQQRSPTGKHLPTTATAMVSNVLRIKGSRKCLNYLVKNTTEDTANR